MPSPLPVLPPDNTTICVVVPNSPEWIRLYLGTLSMLTRWWYYDVNNEGEAEDVVQRAMACNAETGADYEGCMELDCNDVLECILQTPEIQQAIASYSIGSSITATDTENEAILNSNTFPALAGCNNAQVFGMTTQLVDLLNTISLGILDRFVASLNSAGNLGYLIEGIPVIGELPIDDILTFVQTVAVQINTEYQGSADIQLLEDIACDLMCIGMIDCDLTFEEIRDYYQSKINPVIQYDTMEELVVNIVANGWFGDQAVYIIHFFIVQLIVTGGEITGIDANRIIKTVSAYYNDPNNDWSTLCDECTDIFTHTFDFTQSQQGFTAFNGRALWDIGEGFKDNPNAGADNVIQIQRSGFNAFNLVSVEFIYTGVVGLCGGDPSFRVSSNDVNGAVFSGSGDENNPVITASEESITGLWLSMCTDSGSQRIQQIIVKGTGTNPF